VSDTMIETETVDAELEVPVVWDAGDEQLLAQLAGRPPKASRWPGVSTCRFVRSATDVIHHQPRGGELTPNAATCCYGSCPWRPISSSRGPDAGTA
jgi:hypothetical protein